MLLIIIFPYHIPLKHYFNAIPIYLLRHNTDYVVFLCPDMYKPQPLNLSSVYLAAFHSINPRSVYAGMP